MAGWPGDFVFFAEAQVSASQLLQLAVDTQLLNRRSATPDHARHCRPHPVR
jgi:hypothetical protein